MTSDYIKEIIEKYVDGKYFYQDRLEEYLTTHTIVGNEIFSYCDKKTGPRGTESYPTCFDIKRIFKPMKIEQFIRRIPFIFYVFDLENDKIGNLNHLILNLFEYDRQNIDLDELFEMLEFMYYEKNLSLADIFNYIIEQSNSVSNIELFFQWNHYLHLCDNFSINKYIPDCFIASYNELLELSGLSPIIYEIREFPNYEVFQRSGKQIKFTGYFPHDSNGNPIMKWVGLKVKNEKSISCSLEKSRRGEIVIEITPKTVIQAVNCYGSYDEKWHQLYAGPQTMKFNHQALRKLRIENGFKQKQVAAAIEVSERTYQKWESGETTPDGHSLLRLLNWLDITDLQDIIYYID